jgi:hypothetical protein
MSNIGFLFTVGLLGGTVWLAVTRLRLRLDNNWPLVYYFAAVVYLNMYPLTLNPYVAYVAVICALLLRFEFMSERLVVLVRLIEIVALAHLGWTLFGILWRDLH